MGSSRSAIWRRKSVGYAGIRPAWDDLGPQGGVGREHAMNAHEMGLGTRDEGRHALQEFQRGHHQMGGSIAVRGFELQHDLAGRAARLTRLWPRAGRVM